MGSGVGSGSGSGVTVSFPPSGSVGVLVSPPGWVVEPPSSGLFPDELEEPEPELEPELELEPEFWAGGSSSSPSEELPEEEPDPAGADVE